jgi:hypothetical protein
VSDDPEHPIQRSTEAIELRVKWKSSSSLSVAFPKSALVGKQEARASAVNIEYQTF